MRSVKYKPPTEFSLIFCLLLECLAILFSELLYFIFTVASRLDKDSNLGSVDLEARADVFFFLSDTAFFATSW